MRKIKVLIVDDTAFMRNALTKIFSEADDMEVVGTAANGIEAIEKASSSHPDVITMDVDMPVMDGITSLKHIMIQSPIPIVMITSLAGNKDVHFESFRLGSVNVVGKPSGAISTDIDSQKQLLLTRVREAATANRENIKRIKLKERFIQKNAAAAPQSRINRLFVIGVSQGGLNAMIRLGTGLSVLYNSAILVVAYHSEKNIEIFSKRLDELVLPEVNTFSNNDKISLKAGRMYMVSAEHGVNLEMDKDGLALAKAKTESFPINHLMRQVADVFGDRSGGILLSGFGEDGLEGLADIQRMGGVTAIQSAESSLYGEIAEKAKLMSVVDEFLPLAQLSKFIIEEINSGSSLGKKL